MSLENHPNFHAVQFATDITNSYYKSLRGEGFVRKKEINSEKINELILNFVGEIEYIVNTAAENG